MDRISDNFPVVILCCSYTSHHGGNRAKGTQDSFVFSQHVNLQLPQNKVKTKEETVANMVVAVTQWNNAH